MNRGISKITRPDNYNSVLREHLQEVVDGDNSTVVTFDGLLKAHGLPWNGIKKALRDKPRSYDSLLFKLHFRRRYEFTAEQRKAVLEFLSTGYLLTVDIRYMNEFLWFVDENPEFRDLMDVMLFFFYEKLSPGGIHPFPLSGLDEHTAVLDTLLTRTEALRKSKPSGDPPKVGLLGSPTFFTKIYNELRTQGFEVHCFFIPHHQNKMIKRLFNCRPCFFLFRQIKRCRVPYRKLSYNYNDNALGNELGSHMLEIGFHKLGFIIKKNIIEAFKVGLINDHWALLPYVRGRSSIEFSLLMGIPLATTSHFVEEGVDTGDIIACYDYRQKVAQSKTVSEVRKAIRADRDRRAIDSIAIFASSKKALMKNETSKGLTYYSIHPLLVEYIDTNILK